MGISKVPSFVITALSSFSLIGTRNLNHVTVIGFVPAVLHFNSISFPSNTSATFGFEAILGKPSGSCGAKIKVKQGHCISSIIAIIVTILR